MTDNYNHITEDGFQRILEHIPHAVKCTKEQPMDPTIEGVHWVHMNAIEVFDDGENYIEYKCLNCGTHYDIRLPD